MRIVRLANFVMPRSGGLRTALRALGEGYVAAGHECVLIVPGDRPADEQTAAGRVITVPGVRLAWSGGYRVMLGRRRLRGLLDDLAPDRLEVSDRLTLRWTGRWARRHGVPAMMVSHESLDGLLRVARLPGSVRRLAADLLNARTARSYDTVLCTTAWAAREFDRLGVRTVRRVPLGVDLELFHPRRHDPGLRARYATPEQHLIVYCGRLSVEKRPDRGLDALAALRGNGVDAVLVVAGDGPLRPALIGRATGLPVRWLGFVPDRAALAALLATADVVIAPGPIETFGLAALEALACGTPVVADRDSALSEVIGDAGRAVPGDPAAFAEAIAELLRRPVSSRRLAARSRAERFDWPSSVAGFLAAHGAVDQPGRALGGARGAGAGQAPGGAGHAPGGAPWPGTPPTPRSR